MSNPDGNPPENFSFGSRRRFFKGVASIPIPAFLFGESKPTQNAPDAAVAPQVSSLLPADTAKGEPIETSTEEVDGDFGDFSFEGDVAASKTGSVTISISSTLDGAGKISATGAPYLKTEWTAPSDGLYRIEADYTVDSNAELDPEEQEETDLTTTLISDVGSSSESDVVSFNSELEWGLRNRSFGFSLLLSLLASIIFAPLGLFARILAKFAVKIVADELVRSDGELSIEHSNETEIVADFLAEKDRTYDIQLSITGAISGQSRTQKGGFDAQLEADFAVDQFVVFDISEFEEKKLELVGTGTGANYDFTVSGSLRGGSDIDSRDRVFTTRDNMRKADGNVRAEDTDTFYFTGEITEWNHDGSAKVYIENDRWFPYGVGGKEKELRLEGTGTGAEYEFTVSGSLRGGSNINSRDRVFTTNDSTRKADGNVRPEDTDTFYFTGKITDWNHDGSAKVYREGERWFPYGEKDGERKLKIVGTGGGVDYEFSVSGSLRGGSDIDSRDRIFTTSDDTRRADGNVRPEDADTFYFTGEITEWNHDGSAKVYRDGERWFPYGEKGGEHKLKIEGTGGGAEYEFSVSASLRGGTDINSRDRVFTTRDGTRRADGNVRAEDTDTYYFTGEITDWHHDGSAKMFIDGERWFPHTPDVDTTTLTGMVTDLVSGEPIPDAEITILDPDTGETIKTTTSDDQGKYTIDVTSDETYELVVEAPGYAKHTEEVAVGTEKTEQNFKLHSSGIGRFDTNDSGYLEFSEVLETISAFNSGQKVGGQSVDFQDVLTVISVFNSGRPV